MDDERLGEQGFDESAGLEQCRIVPCVEDVEHREIRDVIEDRADWADKQNKFCDVANVPSSNIISGHALGPVRTEKSTEADPWRYGFVDKPEDGDLGLGC